MRRMCSAPRRGGRPVGCPAVLAAGVSVMAAVAPLHGARADNPVELVAQWGGPTYAVAVQSSLAYIGAGPRLLVFDVSQPSSPTLLGRSEGLPNTVLGIVLADSYAFVADSDAGLQIIDIADPTNPYRVGGYDAAGWADAVALVGSLVYVGDADGGLVILRVTLRGDLDRDGWLRIADIDPFVLALTDQAVYQAQYPSGNWLNADGNGDGAVNSGDIDPFVALLSSG